MTGAAVHLVPHTHWDREWYRPFQSFRMQLVDVIDRVLNMLEADDDFAFTLDGQLSTVDDYLEIRPEAAERIAGRVASGRLAIGPWLILMDEFLVSGENMVRNLELGWQRAEAFGGPMRIGYLPDMFGHIAQMPQMLRRAGIADAVVWRGVPAAVDRHAFRWVAPDGSVVRAEYLPAGYGNAAYLFAVPDRLEGRLDHFLDTMRPWFGDDPVLAMYGTDHTAPMPGLVALVGELNELEHNARVEVGTLADYIRSAPPLRDDAPEWHGEMRAGARANVLMGVASARIDIKAACGRAERLLERYAEPLQALWMPSDAWPEAFLRVAWRRVIENSAHDSICGCSVDAVVEQVLVRFAEAEQIAASLARRAVAGIATGTGRGTLAVVNPSPFERSGLVELDVAIPDDWESVVLKLVDGTRLATQELKRAAPLLFSTEIRGDEVDDLFRRFHGREIFDRAWNGYRIDEVDGRRRITFDVDVEPDPVALDVELLRGEVEQAMQSAGDETWLARIVARPRRRLLASIPAPALGWTAARPVSGSAPPEDPVQVDDRRLVNASLRVEVAGDGTLRLTAADGTALQGVGRLVDGGDFGDSYNYGPPAHDRVVDEPASVAVRVIESGPLRGRLAVDRVYEWPAGLTDDGAARHETTVPTTVTTEVELRSGEPFVRLAVAFENRSDDHRVRFHVPLARAAETSHAEGQFAVVERGMAGEGGYREEPLGTYPARGFVDAGGAALLLDHITEYELLGTGELALTVLRSTGLISRNDNPYRQDPAGPEIAIPGAQCRGPWRIAFAIGPHAGSWDEADVWQMAERYQHELLVGPGSGPRDRAWPREGAGEIGLAIDGRGVILSALRRREAGWLELRVVNEQPEPRSATVRGNLLEAQASDLLGRPGGPLTLDAAGALRLDLGAWEIRTVRLRRREPALRSADVLDAAGPRLTA